MCARKWIKTVERRIFFLMTLYQGRYDEMDQGQFISSTSFLYDTYRGAHHHDGIKIMECFIQLERFNEMTQFRENAAV